MAFKATGNTLKMVKKKKKKKAILLKPTEQEKQSDPFHHDFRRLLGYKQIKGGKNLLVSNL